MYKVLDINHQVSFKFQVSDIKYQILITIYQVSDIQYLKLNVINQYQISDTKY